LKRLKKDDEKVLESLSLLNTSKWKKILLVVIDRKVFKVVEIQKNERKDFKF